MDSKTLLSPLSDVVFKALFGREEKRSKIILIDFINSILKLEGKNKITSITHLNPFNLKEFDGDKGSILDLKVENQRNERINIEVQVNKEDDFRKRSLYYWSKMYAETIEEAENYVTLRKCIVINIMDFEIIDETNKYHTEYKILEKEEHFALIDDLTIHYIELPKFDMNKDIERMEANELWLTFMKYVGKPDVENKINKLIERSETLNMAKEMLTKISADEMLRQKFYAREKARLDAISKLKYAEIKGMEKGMKEGIEKGMKKGRAEGKIKLVIKLLKKRFPEMPRVYEEKLLNAKIEVIESIAEDIFDINDIKDLDKYLLQK